MDHDIFISYAWVDNEVYPGAPNGELGWVSTFVDGLRIHLARELGRRDEAGSLWLDYEQMRGNEGLTPTIRAHLEASRTLVLILSNGYLASPWCRKELETFVDRFGTSSGRIFVVWMSPVEEEPEVLRDMLKYSFWYLDERKRPSTRWHPFIDGTDREYAREQIRLAGDLADKLRGMEALEDHAESEGAKADDERNEEPKKVDTDERNTTGKTPKVEGKKGDRLRPTPSDRFVLVNGGAEDRDLVHAIAERLQEHDLGVAVPLSALSDQPGVKSSVLARDLRGKLQMCDSVLMVYRSGPVDQVSQHLIECLKECTKVSRGKTPPTIDLCQTQRDPFALGLRPKGMRIHVVDGTCADECVDWFLNEGAS